MFIYSRILDEEGWGDGEEFLRGRTGDSGFHYTVLNLFIHHFSVQNPLGCNMDAPTELDSFRRRWGEFRKKKSPFLYSYIKKICHHHDGHQIFMHVYIHTHTCIEIYIFSCHVHVEVKWDFFFSISHCPRLTSTPSGRWRHRYQTVTKKIVMMIIIIIII